MKALGLTTAVLVLLAGPAMAQAPPPSPDGHPPSPRIMDEAPRPGGPSKSARFRLRVGNIALGLTCPDDEPLKACADFAMALLDKAQAMQAR